MESYIDINSLFYKTYDSTIILPGLFDKLENKKRFQLKRALLSEYVNFLNNIVNWKTCLAKTHFVSERSLIFLPKMKVKDIHAYWLTNKHELHNSSRNLSDIYDQIKTKLSLETKEWIINTLIPHVLNNYPYFFLDGEYYVHEIILIDQPLYNYLLDCIAKDTKKINYVDLIPDLVWKPITFNHEIHEIQKIHNFLLRHKPDVVMRLIQAEKIICVQKLPYTNGFGIELKTIDLWKNRILAVIHKDFEKYLKSSKSHSITSFVKLIHPGVLDSDFALLKQFSSFFLTSDDTEYDLTNNVFRASFSKVSSITKSELEITIHFLQQVLSMTFLLNPNIYSQLDRTNVLFFIRGFIFDPLFYENKKVLEEDAYVDRLLAIPPLLVLDLQKVKAIISPSNRKTSGSDSYGRFANYLRAFTEAYYEQLKCMDIFVSDKSITIMKSKFTMNHKRAMIVKETEEKNRKRQKTDILESLNLEELICSILKHFDTENDIKILQQHLLISFTLEAGAKRPGEVRYGFIINVPFTEDNFKKKLTTTNVLSQLRTQLTNPFVKDNCFCIFIRNADSSIYMMWNISKGKTGSEEDIEYYPIHSTCRFYPKLTSLLFNKYLSLYCQLIKDNKNTRKNRIHQYGRSAFRTIVIDDKEYLATALFPTSTGTIGNVLVNCIPDFNGYQINNQTLRPVMINLMKQTVFKLNSEPTICSYLQKQLDFCFNNMTQRLMTANATVARHSQYIQDKHYSDQREKKEVEELYLIINWILIEYHYKGIHIPFETYFIEQYKKHYEKEKTVDPLNALVDLALQCYDVNNLYHYLNLIKSASKDDKTKQNICVCLKLSDVNDIHSLLRS